MTQYNIYNWTIDGDEAHAHAIGKREDGTEVEEITLSRAHDAPGWIIEGRDGRVYDTPNQALEQLEHEALDAEDEVPADSGGAAQVNERTKPYGGQAPFLTLTLKNETTGDEWIHPIGQQDASALSEWFADQSDYQRQDLPYELEELASRIVAGYAESENNPDPRPIRPATLDDIRAYLITQSGILNVETDGLNVRCSQLSESGRDLLHWTHSRLEHWTVTSEGGHTWLRGPNGLGWIIKNEDPAAEEELSQKLHGIKPQ